MEKMVYVRPMILSTHPIQFETAQSWNTGQGKDPISDGNDGINWPPKNPNPTPGGDGLPGKG